MPQSRKQREADDKWMQSAAVFFAVLTAAIVIVKTRNLVLTVVVFAAVLLTLEILIVAAARLGSQRLARSGMGEIDLMTGEEFEGFLRALFVRKGYSVNPTPNGADFGADLTLEKDGERTAVQAKHWRNRDVGVKAIQEITAAKSYYRATKTLVVITGSFTKQAIDLAKANGVELWNRRRLALEISVPSPRHLDARSAPTESAPLLASTPPALSSAPTCPKCGQDMVRRTNRHEGTHFWGCSGYPGCRGTRPAESPLS